MANTVGPKGQVVIEKEIRDRLGVQPGWKAIQHLADGQVIIRFIPPTHNRSLAGCLKHLIDPDRPVPTEEELDEAVAAGIAEDWREKEARLTQSEKPRKGGIAA